MDRTFGMVVMVGAGPGDISLITQAGIDWLRWAEVVVYDRLAASELLRYAPADAELVDVGKIPGQHAWQQDAINQCLVDLCKAGKRVVRLKGGDPLIFGRGGEEAIALHDAGCAFRIVPGLTAATAAGACAGIPLTHRGVASSVTFVTGHEDPTKAESAIDYGALAKLDTVVFYMGVRHLAENVARLLDAGRAGDTPAAIVEKASTPAQRVIEGTLAALPALAENEHVTAPALVIVGEVISLRRQTDWSAQLPLAGRTVLITRPRHQAQSQAQGLATLGACVMAAPAVMIHQTPDVEELANAVKAIREYDWVAFTSANGVDAVFATLTAMDLDARAFGGMRIAAVGQATSEALARHGLKPDLMPEPFTTAALGRALAAESVSGARILLPRADLATTELPELLTEAGAQVDNVQAYCVSPANALPSDTVTALRDGQVDWITFTSAATARNFVVLAAQYDLAGAMADVKIASIGPVTTQAIVELGLSVTVEAVPHTVAGLTDAIARFRG